MTIAGAPWWLFVALAVWLWGAAWFSVKAQALDDAFGIKHSVGYVLGRALAQLGWPIWWPLVKWQDREIDAAFRRATREMRKLYDDPTGLRAKLRSKQ